MKAPNSRVLARITCPRCGRHDVALRPNFTIYEHQGFDTTCLPCLGMAPEAVLTFLLRQAGLDVRDDRDTWDGQDRGWRRRQSESDAKALANYGRVSK